jgi:hypothetical protein
MDGDESADGGVIRQDSKDICISAKPVGGVTKEPSY